jgi:hypothetical protein
MLVLFCRAGKEWCEAYFAASTDRPLRQLFVTREEDA